MTAQYLWLIVFSFALYFIVTDESIAAAFYYVVRITKAYIEKNWWWITNNPQNPIVRYMIWRRSYALAKKIRKSIKKNENQKE